MKIKLLVSRAGIDFSQTAGDVIEVDDREGFALIADGQGEAFDEAEFNRAAKAREKAEADERAAAEKAEAAAAQAAIDAELIEAEVEKARKVAEANIAKLRAAAKAKPETAVVADESEKAAG